MGQLAPGVVEEELQVSSLRRRGCVFVARPTAEAGLELFTELQSQDSSSIDCFLLFVLKFFLIFEEVHISGVVGD